MARTERLHPRRPSRSPSASRTGWPSRGLLKPTCPSSKTAALKLTVQRTFHRMHPRCRTMLPSTTCRYKRSWHRRMSSRRLRTTSHLRMHQRWLSSRSPSINRWSSSLWSRQSRRTMTNPSLERGWPLMAPRSPSTTSLSTSSQRDQARVKKAATRRSTASARAEAR